MSRERAKVLPLPHTAPKRLPPLQRHPAGKNPPRAKHAALAPMTTSPRMSPMLIYTCEGPRTLDDQDDRRLP